MELYKIEHLLEQMVSINQNLLDEIMDLKVEVAEMKAELNHEDGGLAKTLEGIKEEFNWIGEYTYGKMVRSKLNTIRSSLLDIDGKLSNIDINTSVHNKLLARKINS